MTRRGLRRLGWALSFVVAGSATIAVLVLYFRLPLSERDMQASVVSMFAVLTALGVAVASLVMSRRREPARQQSTPEKPDPSVLLQQINANAPGSIAFGSGSGDAVYNAAPRPQPDPES